MADMTIRTIDDCVNEAIYTGKHTAIASLLMNRILRKEIRFAANLNDIIKRKVTEKGLVYKDHKTSLDYMKSFVLVSSSNWTSKTFQIDDDTKCTQAQTIRKWLLGDALPARNVIIQICLWMGLSVEESNLLLRSAGYHALYCANIIDLFPIFCMSVNQGGKELTLSEFAERKMQFNQFLNILHHVKEYGTKNLAITKAELVKGSSVVKVDERFASNGEGMEKRVIRMDVSGNLYICTDKKIVYRPLKGSRPALEVSVSQHAEKLFKALPETVKRHSSDDDAQLTAYFQNCFMDIDSWTLEDLLRFVEEYGAYLDELHFGIHQKLTKYLEESDLTRFLDLERIEGRFNINNEEGILLDIDTGCNKKNRKTTNKCSEISRKKKQLTELLSSSWEYDYEYESGYYRDETRRRDGQRSSVSTLFDGRVEQDLVSREKYFVYEYPTKVRLIRVLLAMGYEDQVGTIMRRSGYWDRDWIREEGAEQCEYLDVTDWLFLYLIRFRNRLLEKWAEGSERQVTTYVNQNRSRFPFFIFSVSCSKDIAEYIKGRSKYAYEDIKSCLLIHNPDKVKD